jgi:hypothetical protein
MCVLISVTEIQVPDLISLHSHAATPKALSATTTITTTPTRHTDADSVMLRASVLSRNTIRRSFTPSQKGREQNLSLNTFSCGGPRSRSRASYSHPTVSSTSASPRTLFSIYHEAGLRWPSHFPSIFANHSCLTSLYPRTYMYTATDYYLDTTFLIMRLATYLALGPW